ncbi:MAG: hypothetical protein DMF88_09285 [Acidobacteria bacterium]|nr:MAG: hypothetical protein DMF88_09285 [Acidobacteriota bacterium]
MTPISGTSRREAIVPGVGLAGSSSLPFASSFHAGRDRDDDAIVFGDELTGQRGSLGGVDRRHEPLREVVFDRDAGRGHVVQIQRHQLRREPRAFGLVTFVVRPFVRCERGFLDALELRIAEAKLPHACELLLERLDPFRDATFVHARGDAERFDGLPEGVVARGGTEKRRVRATGDFGEAGVEHRLEQAADQIAAILAHRQRLAQRTRVENRHGRRLRFGVGGDRDARVVVRRNRIDWTLRRFARR